jgi:plasmid maintenance system antidote protein VapI
MNLILKGKIIEGYGSQWRFAHSLGIHEHEVSAVIRGRKALPLDERRKWAELLGDKEERLFSSK